MTDRLHASARVAAVIGAIGSVALTLYAGRANNLPFLMILMSLWVIAPFGGYALAGRFSARWSATTRTALDVVIVIAAVVSVVVYGIAVLGAPRPRATPFVVVPVFAWVLMLAGVPITAWLRRRPDRTANP